MLEKHLFSSIPLTLWLYPPHGGCVCAGVSVLTQPAFVSVDCRVTEEGKKEN